MLKLSKIISRLKSQANPKNVAGMARFGINPHNALGISIPDLRRLAKEIGKNHPLALELWDSDIHEARILAALVAEAGQLTENQMGSWVKDFDSWDICDQVCSNLFDKAPFAYDMAIKWVRDQREFVRRAGFVIMAALAVHDKKAADRRFIKFLPFLKKYSTDERNMVKKAVNWALRQIGKRNRALNRLAIKAGNEILASKDKTARWIASDALRELKSPAVQKRLRKKCG